MSGSGSLNRILETVHQEVQNFSETVAAKGEPVPSSQTTRFVKALQQKSAFLQEAAKGDFTAEKFANLNPKMLDRLAAALSSLGANSALARTIGKPEQQANLGNVLLGLGDAIEKMRNKAKEARIFKKGYKIERFEVVEFLNATEKEFERFIAVIKEREEDEEFLLAFIRELMRRMKIMNQLKKMPAKNLKKLNVSPQHYNRILNLIESMISEESFRKIIYTVGVEGESGNAHLRFWKTLKEFSDLIQDLY